MLRKVHQNTKVKTIFKLVIGFLRLMLFWDVIMCYIKSNMSVDIMETSQTVDIVSQGHKRVTAD